jgi:hypothetical protein
MVAKEDRYALGWISLRRRRRIAAGGTAFLLLVGAAYTPLGLHRWTAFVAFFAASVSTSLLTIFRCPRCTRRFYMHPGPFRDFLGILSRRCAHCGLPLWARDPQNGSSAG